MATNISGHGDEWVRVEGPWADTFEYAIAIDGNEQVIFRVEPCDLFCPSGVSVLSGDFSWDLCADAPLDAHALVARTVYVDCGSARIAAHLARSNDGWVLEDTQLSMPSGSPKGLYAGSFGELRGVAPALLREPETSAPGKPLAPHSPAAARLRWIELLVFRDYGAEGASHVRRYLTNPSPENLCRLGPIMTSRLMPYIRAAQHQQRDRTNGDQGL